MQAAGPEPLTPEMSESDFQRFAEFFTSRLGFEIPATKRTLLMGRLSRRLRALGLHSYGAYWDVLMAPDGAEEVQAAIDRLTTNETAFCREPAHFTFLHQVLTEHWFGIERPLRLWSAACATGEEVYSLAMLLADSVGLETPWAIVGSDISQQALAQARHGLYPLGGLHGLPPRWLTHYCLRGVDEYRGSMLITRALRQRVHFLHLNLVEALPATLGRFEVIFLRNVLIYFAAAVRQQVLSRVCAQLVPGGLLVVGHAEALTDLGPGLTQLRPSVYRWSPRGAP